MPRQKRTKEELMKSFPQFKAALDNGWSVNIAMKQAGWDQYEKSRMVESVAEVREAVQEYVERIAAIKKAGLS